VGAKFVEAGAGEGVDMIGAQLAKTITNNTEDGKTLQEHG
jgi:hypothetical protein